MAALNRLAVILLFIWSLVWSQAGSAGAEIGPDGIRITAEVAPHEVPLNRTARLTVRLEWAGDLDRYEIKRFDNPLMENFSILSTSSANRVQVVGGQPVAIQEYYFMLKPDVLGMAYVDGMVVRYTDIATGKEYRLFANRLEAKVVDPLPEPGSYLWLLWVACFLLVAGGSVLFWRRLQRKRVEAQKAAAAQQAAALTLEQQYHQQLKLEIDLRSVDMDLGRTFHRLSKLVRMYLAEKYALNQLGQTTSELVDELKKRGCDERLVDEAEEILQAADIVKFSGTAVGRDKLERMYTLFESWLR